jgi:hypothetical protein
MGVGILKTLSLMFISLCLVFVGNLQLVQAKTDGIVIVVNTKDNVKLSKQELKRLFMGAYIGYELTAVILPINHKARIEFNTSIIGLTEDRIQSYWAQMRFSGRRQAPQQLTSTQDIVNHLLNHEGSIAYLPQGTAIPDSLKVVYRSNSK